MQAASVQAWSMGVIPGGVRGLQPPHFEVGVAHVFNPQNLKIFQKIFSVELLPNIHINL
jgi:hypothetical protein